MSALSKFFDGVHGVIFPFAGSAAPNGFLLCDGAAVSRSTYAALFDVIGTTYGAGDGSTTFNVPDLRGEFIRGVDSGAGNDPDAASRTDRGDGATGDNVGTKQGNDFGSHHHTTGGEQYGGDLAGTGEVMMSTFGTTLGRDTHNTGGSETRPRNVAVNFIIRI